MIWSRFEQVSCLPNKCQCELARDALIRQPSSFWSSLAYILAGLAIYRNIKDKSFVLKIWALACGLMGLSSLFGHASYIQVAMAFDFASIILILSFFAVLNLLRMMKWSMWYFVLYYGVLVGAMYSMGKFAKIGMCLLVFVFAMGDVVRDEGWNFLKEKTLQLSLGILVISFGFFLLDENHVGCDPTSLFQFHSLWHFGTALSMYFYGKWRLGSE